MNWAGGHQSAKMYLGSVYRYEIIICVGFTVSWVKIDSECLVTFVFHAHLYIFAFLVIIIRHFCYRVY